MKDRLAILRSGAAGLLRRLARDRAGNTLALIAAAIFPLLAMVGSGVDMGRSYLSQSRLQQACDAGVLAARKRLGTEAAITGVLPADAAETGQRFFNINFRNGAYATRDRSFEMTLEEDYAVTGVARVTVPTAVMHVFGFDEVPIAVTCRSQLSASNTDIMMVLDVTGSMAQTNPGDTQSRMDEMRNTVEQFHAQLTAAASRSRLRFGFVPYSTNVNVGHLLADDWVVDEWTYQSREVNLDKTLSTRTYDRNWVYVSGKRSEAVDLDSYPATFHPGTSGSSGGGEGGSLGGSSAFYTCDTPAPVGDYAAVDRQLGMTENVFLGPPPGIQVVRSMQRTENGTRYWLARSGTTCYVKRQIYTSFVNNFERVTEPIERTVKSYDYRPLDLEVSDWRTRGNGCIEERDTYEISDYSAVDLSRALDLDIDRVPSDDDETRWRPMFPDVIYARSINYNGTGSFVTRPVRSTADYVSPKTIGLASCPAPARKLAVMDNAELTAYLDSMRPTGQTYHDIGMIWGGRLISPTGLFADENRDVSPALPTTRHLIFLTDGETEPYDLAYSSYGLEPLDQRRWSPTSALSLKQTVESRFAFACDEVKRKNVTVWVVAFGTKLNPVFSECAGAGHYFEADNGEALSAAFAKIAASMAELRITR